MRKFVSYIFAGSAVGVVAMGVIAPPAVRGLALRAWPAVAGNAMPQIVDRTHKADRLQAPMANDRRKTPPSAPPVLIGCEPVFSALSSGARANFPGRCVAQQTMTEAVAG
jgi:hypothetical protein